MAAPNGDEIVPSGAAPHSNSHRMNGNGTTANGAVINGAAEGTFAPGLSADEMALYDRQIRLWGAQAQEKIRSANILLVSLRALGTEIAKNLTLAGIRSLTIVDDVPVTEEDLGAQFFLREGDIGQPRAQAALPRIQELNPRVEVRTGGGLQDLLRQDQTFYAPFDCVIACDHDFLTLSAINTAARFASRPFYAAEVHGFYGYIFADLIAHEFVIEREKSNVPTAITVETLTRGVVGVTNRKENNGKITEIVKKSELYCPLILANSSPLPLDVTSNRRKLKSVPALLPCLRALFDFQREQAHRTPSSQKDLEVFIDLAKQKTAELGLPLETLTSDFLRSFCQNIGAEMMPTAAFVGGRLSEDVINVLGKREQPIQNFALFDGDSLEGRIYSLYSIPPELALGLDNSMPLDMTMNMDMSMGMAGLNGAVDFSGNLGMNGMAPMQMSNNFGVAMPADLATDANASANGQPNQTIESLHASNEQTQNQTPAQGGQPSV